MIDIFISYAKADADYVKPLARYFEAKGWDVFWDHDIPPGSTWVEFIGQKLDQSRLVLVIWSERSIESKWVRREASIALDKDVLLPVRLEDVAPPSIFASIQSASLIEWDGKTKTEELRTLVDSVIRLIGRPKTPHATPASPNPAKATNETSFRPSATTVMQSSPTLRGFDRRWLFGLTLGALALVIAVLNQPEQRKQPITQPTVSTATETNNARAEMLVAEGDRALNAGVLFDPYPGSATDFYRRALDLKPQHPGALRGIETVAKQFRQIAEAAALAGDHEKLGSALDLARSLPGQQQAAEESAHRLAAETLRRQEADYAKHDLTAAFQGSIDANNFAVANETLQLIAKLETNKASLDALREQLLTAQTMHDARIAIAAKVATLLDKASLNLNALRLIEPAGNNATEQYRKILNLEPGNQNATNGLAGVAQRLGERAIAMIDKREFDNAEGLIVLARQHGVVPPDVDQLLQRLNRERKSRLAAAAPNVSMVNDTRNLAPTKEILTVTPEESIRTPGDATPVAVRRVNVAVEFQGFTNQLAMYGLKEREVRADIESSLSDLGYAIIPFEAAQRSLQPRLLIVKLRTNLNSASGIYSYSTSLSLYDPLPTSVAHVENMNLAAAWRTGNSGIAVQTEIRKVREEYRKMLRVFAKDVGGPAGNS